MKIPDRNFHSNFTEFLFLQLGFKLLIDTDLRMRCFNLNFLHVA